MIWGKGTVVDGYDPEVIRKDACGAWIKRSEYGNHESPFGWEIDHIFPVGKLRLYRVPPSLVDDVKNLRPLQWKNNISKGADYPSYKALVTSEDVKNVEKDVYFTVNRKVQDVLNQLFDSYIK